MTYLILQTFANGRTKQIPVNEGLSLISQQGANYSLIDAETQQPPQALKLIKKGNTLLIEDDGKEIAELNDFFAEGSDATFTTDGTPLASEAASANLISSQTESLAGSEGLLWSAESASSALALSPLTLLGGMLSAGALAAGISGQTTTLEVANNQNTTTNPSVNNTTLGTVRVALRSDLGTVGDRISSIGTLDVTGADAGASIEYSLDGGTTWSNSFNAAEGLNQVQVRQNDNAGNVSPATTFSFTLDTAAPSSAPSATVSASGGLILSGTEIGSTVEYSIDGGTTWTSSFTPVEGNNSVQVRQVDVAGNVSPASTAISFNQDTTAPNAPTASFSAANGLSVTNTEVGAVIEYSIDGGTTWTNSFTPVEGNNSVMVRQTDAAGNVSPASTVVSFNQDTTAPNAPTVALTTDSGVLGDGISNVGSLNVTGLEVGSIVEYSTDGGINWTTAFNAVAGLNNVQVRQTDAAGNVSPVTPFSFTFETLVAAPTVALTTDSALADGITNIGTLNVTPVAGAVVEYSIDAGATWTTTFTAAEGVNNVLVRQTDLSGNISASTPINFTLDTLIAAPTVALTTDSGTAGDGISNIGTLNVTGIEAGALLEYSTNGGTTWTTTFTAAEGVNSVLVRQTDVAGNISLPSAALNFSLDTVAPIAPSVALTTDSGIIGDNISNVGTLNVTGLEVGASTEYSIDGGLSWTTAFNAVAGLNNVQVRQTDAAGNVSPSTPFSFTFETLVAAPTVALTTDSGTLGDSITNIGTLNVTPVIGAVVEYSTDAGITWTANFTAIEGVNNVLVRQTDLSGNISASTPINFTLDTLIAAPTVALTTDSGTAGDGISNIGTLNVTGIEAGALLEYSTNGGTTWTATFRAAEGANSVMVRQTDVAGNISLPSAALNFTLDTVAPLAPTVALTTDSGTAGDGISNIGTLNVTGIEAGALLEYSTNGGTTWTTAFNAAEGANSVMVRQTDVAGNISLPSAALNFTLDTVAPIAPSVALTTDSGTAGDGISNIGTLNVTGIEAGALLEYSTNGGTTWTTSFTAAEGANNVLVRQTDVAGNVSPASAALNFTLDTVAPIAPSVALTTDSGTAGDGISNIGTLNVTGIEAGALIEYSTNGGLSWTTAFTAAEGANNVLVRQTDVAGNVSPSATLNFTLDTVAPIAPSVALTTDSGTAGDGISNIGTLNVTGIEAGALIEYSTNGGTTWTATFTAAEGANNVLVRQTDLAGNISPSSAVLNFSLDTVAPLISSVTPADNAIAIAVTDNIVLNFGENVIAGSGNFVISDGAGDVRNIAVTDAAQVSITGGSVTINPTADLAGGSNYSVTYAAGVLTDVAGNGIAAQADPLAHNFATAAAVIDPIVVFDLVNGVSSSHSGRTFDPNVSYSIYVIIDPVNIALNTAPAVGAVATYGSWSGAGSLGADDTLTFISGVNGATGANVIGFASNIGTGAQPIIQSSSYSSLIAAWTSSQLAIYVSNSGSAARYMSKQISFANLWSGSWATLGVGRDPGNNMISLPVGLLTSQGLI